VWSDRAPTVGLLLDSATDPQDVLVWSGAAEAAREHGVNLLCLDCGHLPHVGPLCALVGPEALDGLVVRLRDDEGRLELIRQKASSLPVVNLAQLQEGYPGIVGGHYEGMRRLLRHLIEVHGYERLAFVQGTVGDRAADARYRAYVDVLTEYGLPHSGDLLVGGHGATGADEEPGEAAVRALLDARSARPDVMVCCADALAIDVLSALSRRGLHVPDDLAVTGFDGVARSRTARSPLTTVAQPWRRMGGRALELLLAQLDGDPIPAQMVVPCDLVVRESCGCWPRAVVEAGAAMSPGLSWSARRGLLLSQMVEVLAGEGLKGGADPVARLVDGLSADLLEAEGLAFLRILRTLLQALPPCAELNSAWQTALSLLRRHLLASPDVRGEARNRAEFLIEQARVLVSETAVRAQAAWAENAIGQAEEIARVGRSLSAHFGLQQLSSVAAREMPKLGVRGLYVCLYEEAAAPTEWCRLVAGYDAEGPIKLEYSGQRFPLHQVLPQGVLTGHRPYALLAEPLASAGQQLGYALFEADPVQSRVYDSLRSQLSGALRGMLLLRQTERDALQLQTAAEVGRSVSSILDPDRLMQTVVDLVLERLDLYYAGLFLVDENGAWTGEPGRWAVLRAGTGQAGEQMLADGHRLEVGGLSMVGQCIARGKARIALDVGKEAARFDNPLLPYTRSELALPLVSRERPIGAMTIQSVEAGVFSTQDVAALQLMADQLANALETASLYAGTREALQRTQILYETSRVLSSTLGQASTLRAILDGLARQAGCVYVALFGVDRRSSIFEPLGGSWRGDRDALPEWLGYPRSLDEGELFTEVYASGTIRISHGWDDRVDERHYGELGLERLLRVVAPIRRRDETVGVVEVGYDAAEAGTIDEQDTDWLTAFLDQAAVALENARLWAETRQALVDAERMYRASQVVAAAGGAEDLVNAVVEGFGADAADCVVLWSAQPETAAGIPMLLSIAGWSATANAPPWSTGTQLSAAELAPMWASQGPGAIYVPDLDDDERLGERTRLALRRWGAASAALVPVQGGEHLTGAILLAVQAGHVFASHEGRRLESLAGQLAVGIERLQLLSQLEQRLRQEQILREVSDRVRGAMDVESVMRTTVQEVGRVLGRAVFFRLDGADRAHVTWQPEEGERER
jgi:DNA-binding LacI/PurR family transcriptional regulator/GAF domain-containing protein